MTFLIFDHFLQADICVVYVTTLKVYVTYADLIVRVLVLSLYGLQNMEQLYARSASFHRISAR